MSVETTYKACHFCGRQLDVIDGPNTPEIIFCDVKCLVSHIEGEIKRDFEIMANGPDDVIEALGGERSPDLDALNDDAPKRLLTFPDHPIIPTKDAEFEKKEEPPASTKCAREGCRNTRQAGFIYCSLECQQNDMARRGV